MVSTKSHENNPASDKFSSIEWLTNQAVKKHKEGKAEEAIAFYLEILDIDREQPEWIYGNVITLLAKAARHDEALKLGRVAEDTYPKSDEINRALGILFKNVSRINDCIEKYKLSIKINARQPDWLYYDLAKQLLKVSESKQAIKVINSGLKQYHQSYLLYYCLGEIFAEEKEWDRALESLKKAKILRPKLEVIQNKLNEVIVFRNTYSIQLNNSLDVHIQQQIEESDLELEIQKDLLNECQLQNEINLDLLSEAVNTFFGEIICISGNQIIGWIADENFVLKNITVKLLVNGLEVNRSKANLSKNQFQKSILKNTNINKRCYFKLQVPDSYIQTGECFCLEVACPDNTVLAVKKDYCFGIRGNIDIINNHRIAGWIVDFNQDSSLNLDLYIDGVKLKSFTANIERNDVQTGLKCGFDIYFPSAIYAGQKIELTLRDSYVPILGTPKKVVTSIGIINILHKLSQSARNNLVSFNLDERQWINSQLIPNLICKYRESSVSGSLVNVNYPSEHVSSAIKTQIKTVETVDVIIPVYKNYQVTKACLESVIKSQKENKTPINIVVIDDLSPEPQISIYLKDIAARNSIELLVNENNLGFVRSVNKGMKLHHDRDVVLLNSDAIVNGDWLDRMKAIGYSQSNIASVTPISNHASIFSYPFFAEETGELPQDASLKVLDRICKNVNSDVMIEVPSVHGFCCYLKQHTLNEVGIFDEQKWEKGYGEEVDWSQRCSLLGWKHVAAPGVFVHHVGSQSFTEKKHKAIARAQKILASDYPEYDAVVQDFITIDSLAPYRRRIDIARLKKISSQYFLFICHDFGGGTKKYLTELSRRLEEEGYQALCLMPDMRNWTKLCSLGEIKIYSRYNLSKTTEFEALLKDLKSINVIHVHINSTIGFNKESDLWQIPQKLEVDFDVTIHDYQFICPRINLTTAKNKYCGEPSSEACDVCIIKNSTYNDVSLSNLFNELGSVKQWRNYYLNNLRKARKILAPTYDVQKRISKYFPDLKIDVKYHPEFYQESTLSSYFPLESKSIYSVALIGAISDIKGYALIQECAAYALDFDLPIKFTIFGYTKDDLHLEEYSNINIVGAFKNLNELKEKLNQNPCDIAAFLSIWPETYSYTLSEALFLGLLPFGLNIGAIGERIRQVPGGLVIKPCATPKNIVLNMIKLCQVARRKTVRHSIKSQVNYSKVISNYYNLDFLL